MFGRLYATAAANFWTPSFWTIAAIIVSHMLHRKSIATHMDKLRDHITSLRRPPAPPPAGKPDGR
jgi:hypothetical protein